jgi:3-(3-hydroxy-phenyl)propionate hydroxylase
VRAFIELAVDLGNVIQTTDPEKARQRDRDLIANPTMLRPIAPRLGPGLHGNAPPPAAARAAQPRLADGRSLDDHVGYRYAVLADRGLVDALPTAKRTKLENEIVLVVAEGEVATYLADLHTDAIVIRPDRHILGTASTPSELDAVLKRRQWPAHPGAISERLPKTVTAT